MVLKASARGAVRKAMGSMAQRAKAMAGRVRERRRKATVPRQARAENQLRPAGPKNLSMRAKRMPAKGG